MFVNTVSHFDMRAVWLDVNTEIQENKANSSINFEISSYANTLDATAKRTYIEKLTYNKSVEVARSI